MTNTKLKEKLYQLMDSFLVETDPPRSVEQLNVDRHLFVENVQQALIDTMPEWMPIRKLVDKDMFPMCQEGHTHWCDCITVNDTLEDVEKNFRRFVK